MTAEPADYIRAFMNTPTPVFERAALVIIDLQSASASRTGALGRRVLGTAQGAEAYSYRFERIETSVVPNTQRLLQAFRAAQGRIVFVKIGAQHRDASDAPPHMRGLFREMENFWGSPEHEILPAVQPLPGESIVTKTSNGAFASSSIDSVLRAIGADQLYLTGVSSNMCVDTTGREAADRGYAVTLVEDACGSTHADLHSFAMRNFARLFGRVESTDGVLAELGLKPSGAQR
ncbi:cysteine hydrolase family protein [Microvirga antarctica]|uniref:cysteine hydrolase family protein n=1 Tax=Microvirga antarctica TaxID=2819233 RepID=UPI001B304E74|nr:isochorismatase family cysteine hydrolase [Microvirga antarctica]